jgi:hypothetical protein
MSMKVIVRPEAAHLRRVATLVGEGGQYSKNTNIVIILYSSQCNVYYPLQHAS